MIFEPTYKAARAVAFTIEKHFADHLALAKIHGEDGMAPQPEAHIIEAIIDATFWASLRKEEGRSPKISLAFLPPEMAGQPLLFEYPLSLTPNNMTKLAPAVERSGIHLGVWYKENELYLWGTTRTIPGYCFVLEVVEPGLLVVKHRRTGGYGKFVNVAILKGDKVKIIDEKSARLPDCPSLLTSLLGFNAEGSWNNSINVLVQLAASMRLHGRGGALLVVPSGSNKWRESIIHPISYPVEPAFPALTELMQQDESERSNPVWQSALNRAVESVAGLTAVDGATVISDQYELFAFGAKIRRSEKSSPIDQLIVTEPVVGGTALIVHPTQNGGTRHLSAAQFVFDQHDAIALVASQDGRFTVFAWSPREKMVHAHRVDSLLL